MSYNVGKSIHKENICIESVRDFLPYNIGLSLQFLWVQPSIFPQPSRHAATTSRHLSSRRDATRPSRTSAPPSVLAEPGIKVAIYEGEDGCATDRDICPKVADSPASVAIKTTNVTVHDRAKTLMANPAHRHIDVANGTHPAVTIYMRQIKGKHRNSLELSPVSYIISSIS